MQSQVPYNQLQHMSNAPAEAMTAAKSSGIATKRGSQASTAVSAHNAVRRGSASTRANPPQETSEQSAKGGKITKPKKTAHNMIEKRYRTNINDKISALRDCVPALRCAVTGSAADDDDELDGLTPANKLNKATILTKATEYIMHLQQRNSQLMRELKELSDSKFSNQNGMMAAGSSANGGAMMGGVPMASQGANGGIGSGMSMGGTGRNMMGKLMMGSMAGMMVANSFNDVDGQDTRGLAAIPFMIRTGINTALGPHAQATFGLLRGFLILGAVMYVFYPSLFEDNSSNKGLKNQPAVFAAQPLSVSSPLEVRQRAWLTAIRTVNVPPRVAPLEFAAVMKKIFKLALRRVVGFDGYRLLVGTTEEEDQVRIAAWRTAIEAQLGGGDAECSHVRLLITLLASFLIRATPVRLMLQALHLKVLLHDYPFLQGVSDRCQRALWEEARELQRQQQESGEVTDGEKTPEHLVNLLECDDIFDRDTVTLAYNLAWNNPCHKGLSVCYRDDGVSSMVDDSSLQSPLDALAAWYSCRKLRSVLVEALDDVPDAAVLATSVKVAPPNSIVHRRALIARSVLLGDICPEYTREMMEAVREDLKVTKKSPGAPVRSMPVTQSKVVTPQFVEQQQEPGNMSAIASSSEDEEEDADSSDEEVDDDVEIDTISASISVTSSEDADASPATGTGESVSRMLSSPDIRVAVRCALIQTVLPSRPYVAEKLYSSLKVYDASELGLLGFVAVLTTVRKMQRRRPVEKSSEALIGQARIWIGGDEGESVGIPTETRRELVKECVKMGLRLGGYADAIEGEDEDEGYATGE
ncbi:hypothetical protein BZA70DRAFT_56883 [Myxozyma melibiosi]|uniref:BHLH domain-containing protein n=1 Tax=Myxozyma melibiosi TaxID=54550 RepID=A0ABR1FFP5_9ASCO